ncbi:MAG: peptidoglycan-binding protein [Hyphomicrobiales bacterium]|nr:peptidoglycan-binding protein [Hyphomicrobiales bacterium]MCP5370731.1 peptidoglycan-binding protein [Hyphomicrobiales bacterium]
MVGPRTPQAAPPPPPPPARFQRFGPPPQWNPPRPPREVARLDRTAVRGRPVVAETQRMLAELGYDPGPADGVMKPRTRTALAAYQSDSGLPVNGRMTRRVVERLRRDAR